MSQDKERYHIINCALILLQVIEIMIGFEVHSGLVTII